MDISSKIPGVCDDGIRQSEFIQVLRTPVRHGDSIQSWDLNGNEMWTDSNGHLHRDDGPARSIVHYTRCGTLHCYEWWSHGRTPRGFKCPSRVLIRAVSVKMTFRLRHDNHKCFLNFDRCVNFHTLVNLMRFTDRGVMLDKEPFEFNNLDICDLEKDRAMTWFNRLESDDYFDKLIHNDVSW